MLERLNRMPKARAILPFVRLSEWRQRCSEPGRRRRARGPADAFAVQHWHSGRSGRGCCHSGSGRRSTTIWRGVFSGWQAFTFTSAKQECGTKPASHQKMSTFLARGVASRGHRCVGTALGSAQFVSGKLQARVEGCGRRSPQCPICNVGGKSSHPVLPPGRQHDEGVWNTAVALLEQLPGTAEDIVATRSVASLPMRMGGLGLRSAARGQS